MVKAPTEETSGNSPNHRPIALWRNPHLWYITVLVIVCSMFYYTDAIIDSGWFVNLQWSILFTVHDLFRSLFLMPILYAAYIFRMKGVVVTTLLSLLIFLPRSLFISPYPDPLLRSLVFLISMGIVGIVVSTFMNKTFECEKLKKSLLRTSQDLEIRVEERTRELSRTSQELTAEVAAGKCTLEQLKELIQEKEVLLQEVHHRVKNNLQVVSSLLDISSLRTQDKAAIDLIKNARSKIQSISLVHSQIYANGRLDQVKMGNCVREMVSYLLEIYAGGKQITPIIEVTDISLELAQAVPYTIVLNELVTNALKHAFEGREKGMLKLSLEMTASGTLLTRVKDDGTVLPSKVDIATAETMGLKLVRHLVNNQLKGTVQVKREGGTEFFVELKP